MGCLAGELGAGEGTELGAAWDWVKRHRSGGGVGSQGRSPDWPQSL